MSRPTLPPPPKGCSPEEIAAQVAAFEAAGGKAQTCEPCKHAQPAATDMHTQHDSSWRAKINGESKKAAGK